MRGAAILACLLIAACDPGVRIGQTCVYDRDCPTELACVIGRCRAPCAEARDCPDGRDCLRTATGVSACALAVEDRCEGAPSSCGESLTCDGTICRQSCATVSCAGGMSCAAGICVRDDATDAGVRDATVIDAPPSDAPSADGEQCTAPCEPAAQCGCPSSRHCGVVAGTVGCIDDGGALALGDACSSEGECAPGLGCQGGRCVRYCDDAADCGPGTSCDHDNVYGSTLAPGVDTCGEACSVLPSMGSAPCAMGVCTLGVEATGPVTYCSEEGAGIAGAPCSWNGMCEGGTFCESWPPGQPRRCMRICDPTISDSCGGGVTCDELDTVRGVAIGACLLP